LENWRVGYDINLFHYARRAKANCIKQWLDETMLRKEQNDLLTQTGKGSPMGEMFRRYWIPALLSEELPENDCPPVRVKLLSERLIAFRDSKGRLGLLDEFCPHRGISLWFGRNEECGRKKAASARKSRRRLIR
jgi:hypothetical protein